VITLVGVVAGLGLAYGIARHFQKFLLRVEPHDFPTFTLVSALLFAVALIACWLPARRATRVDPLRALRAE
jgi:putative ABC transport system permease protein